MMIHITFNRWLRNPKLISSIFNLKTNFLRVKLINFELRALKECDEWMKNNKKYDFYVFVKFIRKWMIDKVQSLHDDQKITYESA